MEAEAESDNQSVAGSVFSVGSSVVRDNDALSPEQKALLEEQSRRMEEAFGDEARQVIASGLDEPVLSDSKPKS